MRMVTFFAASSDDPARIRTIKYIFQRPSPWNMDYDRLIQCVLQRMSLWDQKDKHYHNRDVKKKLLEMLLFQNKQILCCCKRSVFFKYNFSLAVHWKYSKKFSWCFKRSGKSCLHSLFVYFSMKNSWTKNSLPSWKSNNSSLYKKVQIPLIRNWIVQKGNKSGKFTIWVFSILVFFCYRRWRKLTLWIFRTCSLSVVSDSTVCYSPLFA
jgi:hypothetical protein